MRSLLLGLAICSPLAAQLDWSAADDLAGVWSNGATLDTARGRIIVLGSSCDGPRAWSFDGITHTPLPDPPLSSGGSFLELVAYDAARDRVVAYDPIGSVTWEFDGTVWIERTDVVGPPLRSAPAMAYDPVRQETVLFGGSLPFPAGITNETWTYDGVAWQLETPTSFPGGEWLHSMAYDPVRDRMVVSPVGPVARALEWDGSGWTTVVPTSGGTPDGSRSMVFDAATGQMLVFTTDQVWSWDGATYTPVAVPDGVPRNYANLAPLPTLDGIYVGSGRNFVSEQLPDHWVRQSGAWQRLTGRLDNRWNFAISTDTARDRIVVFGGRETIFSNAQSNTTYEFDGVDWIEVAPATTSPSVPVSWSRPSAAYDVARGETVVLFSIPGGGTETWGWDGVDWTLRATGGPASEGPIAYDSARQRVVLYRAPTSGTWEWDGVGWTVAAPTVSPALNGSNYEMAYDAARERTVLFGSGKTWLWDGSDWVDASPATSPPETNRVRHQLAYDPFRQRVVLAGGQVGTFSPVVDLDDVWDWDGVAWTQRATIPCRSGRASIGLAPLGDEMYLVGGRKDGYPVAATWRLAAADPASVTTFGTGGCPGTLGIAPTLAATTLPWFGDTLQLTVSDLPSTVLGTCTVLIGDSNTSFAGLTLPLDMSPYGLPGCDLEVAPVLSVTGIESAGTSTVDIAITGPVDLIGQDYYAQVLAFDPGANPADAILSNALVVGIGGR